MPFVLTTEVLQLGIQNPLNGAYPVSHSITQEPGPGSSLCPENTQTLGSRCPSNS